MEYQMKEFVQKTGLSAHTLRYYEKEGLLPFVTRNDAGIRCFTEQDLDWIRLISCLKTTGMPIREIRQFILLCQKGDETLGDRLTLFVERKKAVLQQIGELEHSLEHIEHKISYYQKVIDETNTTPSRV